MRSLDRLLRAYLIYRLWPWVLVGAIMGATLLLMVPGLIETILRTLENSQR